MKLSLTLSFCIALFALLATAAPTELSADMSPAEDANELAKRSFTACSSGVAINCGSASTSCSGRNCKVCCGSCCKKVTGNISLADRG